MDFLQGNFDIQTLRLLSGSGPTADVPHEGTPVFVSGKKVPLFNAYDAIEMALKDELLSTISDHAVVDDICDLLMDDFVRAKDDACDASDLGRWFAATNIAAACMMEFVLPMKLVGRVSLRLRNCFGRICRLTASEDLLFS